MIKLCVWFLGFIVSFSTFASEMRLSSDLSELRFSDSETLEANGKSSISKVEPVTNPARLYPPSCISAPLTSTPYGPGSTGIVSLRDLVSGLPISTNLFFWRIPCSVSQSAFVITLGSPVASLLKLPIFKIRQDAKEWTVRLAHEPNTRYSYAAIHPGGFIATYVVEILDTEYDSQGAPDLNREFDISVSYSDGALLSEFTRFDAYQSSSYANVPSLIPINGRMTGAYYQPGKDGEGILLEVAEAGSTSFVVVSWYTFDSQGFPFWLVGSAVYNAGDTSVSVNLLGKSGGRIGGQFDPAQLQDLPWGAITLSFPNCSTLDFNFQSNHSIPGVPVGSGQRTWTRATSINGYACE